MPTQSNETTTPEELTNETVLAFLRLLDDAENENISCDELFVKLDQYVQREVDQTDAAHLRPVVRDHLDLCPECCEEYEALLDVLEKTAEK